MEAFRQFLKGWLGKLLLFIFLAPLALLGIESYFTTRSNPNELASVGEEHISQNVFNTSLQSEKNRLLEHLQGDASLINEDELKNQVLKSLIDKAVLQQHSHELGLSMSDAQISQMIHNDPSFHDEKGEFSQTRFETLLKSNGIDKRGLFARVRNQAALSQLVQSVNGTAFITQKESKRLMDLQNEEREVWRHKIDAESFANEVDVTDKQIQDYFDTHKATFKTKRMVDLRYITLDRRKMALPNVSDDELKAAYDLEIKNLENGNDSEQRKASHILFTGDDAQKQATEVLAKLKAGGDFNTLAKQHSQDSGTKDKGGQLDFAGKGIYDPEFEKALFALKNKGDLSAVVTSSFGTHIIRLDDIKASQLPTLADMKDKLTSNLQQRKQEDEYQALIAKINNNVVDGQSMADIATAEKLTVLDAKNFEDKVINSAVLQGHGELNHPDVKKQIFDEYNLQEQAPSVGVKVSDNETVWVESSNYRPVRQKTFDESKEEIQTLLAKKAAMSKAKANVETLVNNINATKSLDTIEEKESIEFDNLGAVNRQVPLLSSSERSTVFSTPLKTDDIMAVYDEADNGYSVLVIKKAVEKPLPDAIKKQFNVMLTQILAEQQFSDYLVYTREHADIKKNEEVINKTLKGEH